MQWFSTILSQTGSFLTRNQLPRFDDLDDLEQDNSADNGDSPSEHLSFAISQSHFPIDKLFTELLCMIFAFCCEVEYPEAPPLAEKRDDKIDLIQSCSPLTLVHVSQRWREAGMRLKPMWTFIRVTDSTPLSKICFWLDRSGSHPLNTLIEDVHPNRLLAAYHLLVPHAKRWCEFRILAGETCLAGPRDRQWHLVPFLERRKEHNAVSLISAPILSVLHLQKRLSFILLMDQTTNYPSLSTSMLQKLTITRLNLDWNHLRHHMALSGITELEVDQSFHQAETNVQLMQSISRMTALKHLRVTISFSLPRHVDISLEAIAHPMRLPNLQELALRITGPRSTFWAWMTNLDAPRLWNLFLRHRNHDVEDVVDEDEEQQRRAALGSYRDAIRIPSLCHFHCQLEPPSLHGGVPNIDLIVFVPAITTISQMTLDSWSGTNTFSTFLSFDCTFPQLNHAKFRGALDNPKEDESELSEAVARLSQNAIVTFEEW